MTTIIKTLLGFCAFLGLCALLERLSDWMLDHAPDWIWIPFFMAIPVGMLIWLWKWYRQTVERGSIICTKPIVSRVIQANDKWSCSDYEQRKRKARRK